MIASRKKERWNGVENIETKVTYLERVDKFEYVGAIIPENDDMEVEIKARLTKGNRCYYALGNLMI
jgi:hypothetical protein